MRPPHASKLLRVLGLVGVLGLAIRFVLREVAGRWSALAIDFPTFYFAPRVFFLDGGSPYDAAALLPLAPKLGRLVNPFIYPPPSLMLFSPVAALDYGQAWRGYLILSVLAVLGLAAGLGALVLPARRRPSTLGLAGLGLAFLLSFQPLSATFAEGQLNVPATLALLGGWLAVGRDRPALAGPALGGVGLAVGTLLKLHYGVFFGLFLLLSGRAKAVFWGVALVGLCALAVGVMSPLPMWSLWSHQVAGGGYGSAPSWLFPSSVPWNQSLNGLFSRLYMDGLATPPLPGNRGVLVLQYIASGGLLAATALMTLRVRRKPDPESERLCFGAWLALAFLLSPFSWNHHLVFVLPALAVAARSALDGGRGRMALFGLAALLLWVNVPESYPGWRVGAATLLISTKGLCVLLLWALLIGALRDRLDGRELLHG